MSANNISRFIREQECKEITGLSRPTRWRLEKDGEFPKRRKITKGTVGWLASEIDDWVNSKEAKGAEPTEAPAFGRRAAAGGANNA